MGVYKNTEIPKKCTGYAKYVAAHYCKLLFTWSIICETSGNMINIMLQSVPSLWSMM